MLRTLKEVDLNARGTIRTQRYFLDLWHHPKAEAGLHILYERASWPEARAALRKLSGIQDRVAIPLLVTIAVEADPTIQKEICDALARIGDPSAEPLLIELVGHTDAGRTLAAAQALVSWSRRALPALSQARTRPGRRQTSWNTVECDSNHPSQRGFEATEGAVSLALMQR